MVIIALWKIAENKEEFKELLGIALSGLSGFGQDAAGIVLVRADQDLEVAGIAGDAVKGRGKAPIMI